MKEIGMKSLVTLKLAEIVAGEMRLNVTMLMMYRKSGTIGWRLRQGQ
jgi:hypothetical protein